MKIYLDLSTNDPGMKLQENIEILEEWCANTEIKLNVFKCYCVSYTRTHIINNHVFIIMSSQLHSLAQINDLDVTFEFILISILLKILKYY